MSTPTSPVRLATDVCALPLARRLAAMLDRDPASLREGDPLPRGWHPMLFNTPTPQSQLRADGAADLGVTLPELGLPRLMLGGRQSRFHTDIPIGAAVRRETRLGDVQVKDGRSGRFALVKVQHRIFVGEANDAAVEEDQDYILRAASEAAPPGAAPAAPAAPATPAPAPASTPATADAPVEGAPPALTRVLVPDEPLLFRYSSITDNPHRIHYDQPYATTREGYPALVVNGSIPAMFLLEMLRQAAGREPVALSSRNLTPMFCGQPLTLTVLPDAQGWLLRAADAQGRATFEARAR